MQVEEKKMDEHILKYHTHVTCERCLEVFPSKVQLRAHCQNKHSRDRTGTKSGRKIK